MPIIYKCPNCGAAMEFSSELQKLECKRCGTSIDVKTYEDEYAFNGRSKWKYIR